MKYNAFVLEVQKQVTKIVNSKYEDVKVVIRKITKNNGVELKAISFTKKGDNSSPNIYLPSFYSQYTSGKTMDEICINIISIYENNGHNVDFNIDEFTNFNLIKPRLFYKLVNYNLNKENLENIPHIPFLDLAITFYAMLYDNHNNLLTINITNNHMETWGITLEELKEVAETNSWKKQPPIIKKMEDIISEMIIEDITDENDHYRNEDDNTEESSSTLFIKEDFELDAITTYPDTDIIKEDFQYGEYSYEEVESIVKEEMENIKEKRNADMYILTNKIKLNGAICILYPNVLKDFAENCNSNIYIIPSSIHEVILVPSNEWEKDYINDMIREVNENEVEEIEVLSDHVYLYNIDTEKIEM